MNPDYITIGDPVKASPVGPGKVTDITNAGYPRVDDPRRRIRIQSEMCPNPGGQAMSRQAFEEWLKTQPPENWWEVSEAERIKMTWQAATNAALERATKPEEWRAMVYAPLDGTKITMLIRHTTWWAAHKHDPAKANIWEAECEGHWIDFNGGGWTWAGMAGTPIGWRALKDEK